MPPTAGNATIDGLDVVENSLEVRRIVGYLPETVPLYNDMTVYEYLKYMADLRHLKNTQQRIEEVLEQVGMTDRLSGYNGKLSKGMRQRLGLAQALVNHPQVIFLDEPLSALDPAGRRDVLELITRLKGETTVLMSTHILADVERVCDTIGIINHGRMVTTARQDVLMDQYVLPVFEVEGVPGAEPAIRSWEGKLARFPWFESGNVTEHTARIQVKDLEAARSGLLDFICQEGLVIDRFEAARPSLEDIFLKLVGEKETVL
jgi:ABC-2 type transport system ATP-binding protein